MAEENVSTNISLEPVEEKKQQITSFDKPEKEGGFGGAFLIALGIFGIIIMVFWAIMSHK